MNSLLQFLENVNEWIGRIFSWVMAVLTILVVLEVIMRRFFGHPTIWNFEVTKQFYAFLFMMLAAFALLHKAHVSIDIVESKLRSKVRAGLRIVSYLIFFFPFCAVVLWQGIRYASKSWAIYETSWSVFAPPLYLIKTVIPLTAFLLLLQGLSVVIKDLQQLRH